MKKSLLFLAVALMIVGCGSESEKEPQKPEVSNSGQYVGTVIVAVEGEPDYFKKEDFQIQIVESDSIEGKYDIKMLQAQFAENMPIMDISVPSVSIENNMLSGDNIVPVVIMPMGNMPIERYLITNLEGTITYTEQGVPYALSMTLDIGPYPTSFSGKYVE